MQLLLVEDEEHLAFSLEYNLVAEGYQVDVAGTLADARRHLDQTDYELIVLDVMLPDGNGMDFCRGLRDSGDTTPVLMLTALDATDNIIDGLSTGADDYVPKPFDLRELIGRIEAVLRRRRWEREQVGLPDTGGTVELEGHQVDLDRREVTNPDGEQVTMTDLEFELLSYFIRHPHQVVTRENLLESVWKLPATTNTRTVDNFIVRLRKRFEPDPAEPSHFLTVRGAGYRFRP